MIEGGSAVLFSGPICVVGSGLMVPEPLKSSAAYSFTMPRNWAPPLKYETHMLPWLSNATSDVLKTSEGSGLAGGVIV
jgi:hypothetical protein